jgi:hypothetical protein
MEPRLISMSQIYSTMNKTGKIILIIGSSFSVIGLLCILLGDLETRLPILGAALLATGLHYLGMAMYDTRCNINNDTKGVALSQSSETVKG